MPAGLTVGLLCMVVIYVTLLVLGVRSAVELYLEDRKMRKQNDAQGKATLRQLPTVSRDRKKKPAA